MTGIKKIQPKVSVDIDLDVLTQKIKASKDALVVVPEANTSEEILTQVKEPKTVKEKPKKIQPIVIEKELKKAGRKKTNTETMHRFAIDLPEWLFEQIRQDATTNFSTVRGEIIKVLLKHYKKDK